MSNSLTSNATPRATILLPTSRVARVARGSHCSQSGNMIHVGLSEFLFSATTHCCTVHSDTPGSPPQCTTGCWCCDISSSPPCGMHHCAMNHSFPNAESVIVYTADDWDWAVAAKWSWSGLYQIAGDRRVFPASRSNADEASPNYYYHCYNYNYYHYLSVFPGASYFSMLTCPQRWTIANCW